ncbi:TPA: hypothetical protein BOS_676 [Bos taurus]|nr:TPA: hypothetical protein BOS_676 [Bos taurus]
MRLRTAAPEAAAAALTSAAAHSPACWGPGARSDAPLAMLAQSPRRPPAQPPAGPKALTAALGPGLLSPGVGLQGSGF